MTEPEQTAEETTPSRPSVRAILESFGVPVEIAVWVVGGLVVIAIAGLVAIILAGRRGMVEQGSAEASWRLREAQSVNDINDVLSRYADSDVAPVALLRLAQSQFQSGYTTQSMSTLDRFTAEYPKHPLLYAAILGRISCVETQGAEDRLMLVRALSDYEEFPTRPPLSTLTEQQKAAQLRVRHLLVMEAEFGRARCLERLGRLQEAKQVYEEMKVEHPDSARLTRVESLLETLEADIERAAAASTKPRI